MKVDLQKWSFYLALGIVSLVCWQGLSPYERQSLSEETFSERLPRIASNGITLHEGLVEDPFSTVPIKRRLDKGEVTGVRHDPILKVEGIFISKTGRMASVNSGLYKVGDYLKGYRIKAIEENRVVFTGKTKEISKLMEGVQ